MELTQIVGNIAAICTTWAFLPQVLQVIKTRDTKSISLWMYIFFIFWVILWLTYWLLLGEIPIILANVFTLILASIILVYKIKYK